MSQYVKHLNLRNVCGEFCHAALQDKAVFVAYDDAGKESWWLFADRLWGVSATERAAYYVRETGLERYAERLRLERIARPVIRAFADNAMMATCVAFREPEGLEAGEISIALADDPEFMKPMAPVMWIDYPEPQENFQDVFRGEEGKPRSLKTTFFISHLVLDMKSTQWNPGLERFYEPDHLPEVAITIIPVVRMVGSAVRERYGVKGLIAIAGPSVVAASKPMQGRVVLKGTAGEASESKSRIWVTSADVTGDLRMTPEEHSQDDLDHYVSYHAMKYAAYSFFANRVANTEVVRVAPTAKVPKNQHDWPKFEYRVIRLRHSQSVYSERGVSQVRKSPRQHLRRGHLRRYKSGVVIWINPMIVGDSERGTIIKDYMI